MYRNVVWNSRPNSSHVEIKFYIQHCFVCTFLYVKTGTDSLIFPSDQPLPNSTSSTYILFANSRWQQSINGMKIDSIPSEPKVKQNG